MTEPRAADPDVTRVRVGAHRLERGRGPAFVHTARWPAAPGAPADAPVQVCVHGLGGSHLNWTLLGPRMTGHGAVWAPDLAGFGFTPAIGRSSQLEDNVDLLTGFVRTVSPRRPVVLLGNSMGGLIALTLAARQPDLVAGLVLFNPAVPPVLPRLDPEVALRFLLLSLPWAGRALLTRRSRRLTPAEQVQDAMELCVAEPENLDVAMLRTQAAMTAYRRRQPGADAAVLAAARSVVLRLTVARRKVWADIDAVEAPVLLLHGGCDRLVRAVSEEQVARRRPDWQQRLHPDLGHVPMLEAPERVAADITSWRARTLAEVGAAPG